MDASPSGARFDFWADPSWLRIHDGLVSGLRHEVSGRASALKSLSSVAGRTSDVTWLEEELATESARLLGLVGLLQALPTAGGRDDRALSLADLLEPLGRLLALIHEYHDVGVQLSVDPGVPAVQAGAGPLGAVLLTLMAAAADADGAGRVLVRAEGRDGTVRVHVGADEPGASPDPMPAESLERAQALLSPWAITVGARDEPGGWTLDLVPVQG